MASSYTVERSASIRATPETIFEQVGKFKNWPAWSPWEELDPDMTKTYTGTDGDVGSGYSWSGNRRAGQGSMELTSVDAPRGMTSDLEFLKPFKSSNKMSFDLAPDGDSTTVTWNMVAPHNLLTRIMNVFGLMDKQIGKDFEKGLAKLKSITEG